MAALVIVLMLAAIEPAEGSPQFSGPEDEVMAALILGFVRYAEWPPGAAPQGPPAPIVVGVSGRPSLVRALTRMFRGRTVAGHPLSAQQVNTTADATQCHVLFIASDNRRRVKDLLAAVQHAPVLTIGDSEAILGAGGMVQFYEEDGKLRFVVDQEALARARVGVSARLLRLGQVVKGRTR